MATSLVFLTPLGMLVALGCVLPVLAVAFIARRARRVRGRLGLAEPSSRRLLVGTGSAVAAGIFLGLAAAQPVLERTVPIRSRTDAEAFFVVDVSRSMLAQRGTGSRTRIERAKDAARRLRASLQDVPVGIASMTDRVLPHLFPGADEEVFEATLERSVGVDQPPPRSSVLTTATTLEALAAIRTQRYFSPSARQRLVVVFTDGETQPVAGARLAALFGQSPPIHAVFVRLWGEDERVYSGGNPERQYRPDPSARALLNNVAESVGGRVFGEGDLSAAGSESRRLLGKGTEVVRREQRGEVPLAAYLAAAAFAPVLLLLFLRDR